MMKKEDFVNTNRLVETTPEEIENDWNIYQKSIIALRKKKKNPNKMTKEDFVNTNRLWKTTPEEIENDWNLYQRSIIITRQNAQNLRKMKKYMREVSEQTKLFQKNI